MKKVLSNHSILEIFADNCGKYVFWKDRNSVFLGCNSHFAKNCGIASKEDIVGKNDFDMPWSREEAEFFRSVDKRVMDSGEAELDFEEPKTLANGKKLWLKTSKKPLFDENGQVVGLLGWYSDITAIKNMEEQIEHNNKNLLKNNRHLENLNKELEHANLDLENFTYAASHDLKTPVRTIVSMLQLIERKHGKSFNQDASELFQFTINAGKRMSALISDILAYARTGKSNSDTQPIILSKIIDEKLVDLGPILEDQNAKVTLDLPAKKIYCYPQLIGSVFINLINNGIKFNDSENPTININHSECDQFYTFQVADNGIGIDEKYRNNVFDTFKRLHNTLEYDGSGIGLSICRRVVTIHGGKIWITDNPTGGTIFNFSISKSI